MGLAGRVTNDPTNYFALGVQGAKDVTASTFYFFKHLSGSGFDVSTDVQSEREGGAGREVSLRYKSMVKPDGQVVAYARPDVAGRLLTYALGADTASIIASTAQGQLTNHLIQSGVNATLPYLTAQQQWADMVEQTTNNLIADLKVEGQAGRPIKLTAQFVSGGTITAEVTPGSPSREAAQPFMQPGASFSLSVSGGLDAGATSIEMTKFTLDIKNTLDDAIQTLGLNREDVLWLLADYSLDGTLKYTDKNIWSQVNYGGGVGTTIQVGIPTCSFNLYSQTTGASTALQLAGPLMNISALKVNRLDPDGKTMYLDFTAETIKGATNSLFANVVSFATSAYTATAT
jgi:hypothetical protein